MNDGTDYAWDQPRQSAKPRLSMIPMGIEATASLPDGYDIEISDKVVLRSGQPTELVDDGNLEAQ